MGADWIIEEQGFFVTPTIYCDTSICGPST